MTQMGLATVEEIPLEDEVRRPVAQRITDLFAEWHFHATIIAKPVRKTHYSNRL